MYFADVNPVSANLTALEIIPLQIRQFHLVHPSSQDIDWIRQILNRESQRFGTHATLTPAGKLALSWPRFQSAALASTKLAAD
jgi:hypothetical protein